ncbi:MAG: methyltransferase domain-containing protein [Nanoarchaeota archaeon]
MEQPKFEPTENQYKPVVAFLRKYTKKAKLLEIGAGDRTLKKFLPGNIAYESLDFDPNYGKAFFKAKHDYHFDLDKGKLPVKTNSYDIIVCLETLEHTMYPQRVIDEMKRVAKADALFFISIPNDYNILLRLYYLFGKKHKMDEAFMVVEKHLHIHKVRAKDIVELYGKNFNVKKTYYIWQSRNSMYSKTVYFIDRMINLFSNLLPGLFGRMVLMIGTKK